MPQHTCMPDNGRGWSFSTSLRLPHPGNGHQAACVPGLADCSGLVDLLLQHLVQQVPVGICLQPGKERHTAGMLLLSLQGMQESPVPVSCGVPCPGTHAQQLDSVQGMRLLPACVSEMGSLQQRSGCLRRRWTATLGVPRCTCSSS